MLQQICEYLHNYFIKDSHTATYEIASGMVSLSFMKEGQRFMICGSDLNDGIYTYHANGIKNDDDTEAAGLHDETFAGTICALSVPPALFTLSAEIKTWVETNSGVLNSPLQSESFNGYSYSLKSGSGSNGSVYSWQDQFGTYLNRWRKICV